MGDELAAIHEASHLAVARLLGWTLRGASVKRGRGWAGCARFAPPPVSQIVWQRALADQAAGRPLMVWPAPVRAVVEAHIAISLAGDAGQLALGPPAPVPSRAAEPVAERAAAIAEGLAAGLPEPAPEDLAAFAAIVDDPGGESDEEQVANLAHCACAGDVASAASLIGFCDAQARYLIAGEADAIRRLALALELREALSGEAASRILDVQGPGAD
jgi:hypothetical protein